VAPIEARIASPTIPTVGFNDLGGRNVDDRGAYLFGEIGKALRGDGRGIRRRRHEQRENEI
jgi:hypothetical protein